LSSIFFYSAIQLLLGPEIESGILFLQRAFFYVTYLADTLSIRISLASM